MSSPLDAIFVQFYLEPLVEWFHGPTDGDVLLMLAKGVRTKRIEQWCRAKANRARKIAYEAVREAQAKL